MRNPFQPSSSVADEPTMLFDPDIFPEGLAASVSYHIDPKHTLNFDGGSTGNSYNRGARVLAISNIGARADGNDMLLILNRFGGNLALGASTLATVFGLLYDDSESVFSFSVAGGCQLRGSLSNTFPRTTPRFETVIPAGRSGWFKVWGGSDIGILGAIINANANAAASASAFNGGRKIGRAHV